MHRLKTLCLSLLTLPALLTAMDFCENLNNECFIKPPSCAHQFYIGPEVYYVDRKREGGTHQDGFLYGVRLGYDRIKRYKFYWGFDGLYATGHLSGKNSGGNRIKSDFTDASTEGRLGYTFKCKTGYRLSFTPYIGVGYYLEQNDFKKPSPIPAHFRTEYAYGAIGFLSQVSINCLWDVGINLKAKWPYNPKCHISHDPEEENSTQNITERLQYRVELPVTYHTNLCLDRVLISFVPFYEYRRYGAQANYPFDYFDTQFNNYGLLIKFMYCL